MPFDPNEYNKYKNTLQSTVVQQSTNNGFDPAAYEKVKASVVAPPQEPARSGLADRVISSVKTGTDATRRAFMGSPEPPKNNVIQNALSDAENIVTGTSHLIGQGNVEVAKLIKDAALVRPLINRVKNLPGQAKTAFGPEGRKVIKEDVITPAVESFKKSFSTPIDSLHDHPLFTVIDWSTVLDLAGGAARGGLNLASKGAKAAGAIETAAKLSDITSTVRSGLEVAPRSEIPRAFSKNPIVKYGLQKPFDKIAANPELQQFLSSNALMKYIAPSDLLTPEARSGRVADKVVKSAENKFYAERNARMDEAMQKFNSLPKNERESFVAVVQGRAMPTQMSPQFHDVYDWYKNVVADEQTKFNLTDETVKRVAYQPLATSSGLLTPDDYKMAYRGDEAAVAKVRQATDDLAKSRVRVQNQAFKEFMGADVSAKEIKEITKETAPEPIYFPSVFQDKIKIADFMPNRFLQKFKPGFMKGRTGAFGFIENDPAAAFAVHQSQVERYLHNEALISSIKDKFAEPLAKAADLKPGYKVFAPEGYIGFYRGSMPLQEAFLRGVGMGKDVDAAFLEAIQKVMPEMVQDKNFIGVRRPKLFQVPEDVAKSLSEQLMPAGKVPEPFKLLYDKPLQAFKYSVLGMSPRWIVNNTVGNIVTTMVGRVSPESGLKALDPAYKAIIPPEVSAGGFRRAEFPGIKKVVGSHSGLADKITSFFGGELPTEGVLKGVQNVVSAPVKAIGKFSKTIFEANSKVEDLFRNATFIDKTTKAAVEEIAKKTTTGILDMKTALNKFLQTGDFAKSNVINVAKEMLQKPEFKEAMVGEVNKILNDYSSMSKFERNVVRRVIPFWSWWKFVNVLFWTLPAKDAMMAQTLKQLGQVGNDISAGEWKANGLNVKEIPEWMRGNVILGKVPQEKLLEMLNTRSLNPLSSASEPPSLSPIAQIAYERRTGRRFPGGQAFSNIDETEVNGVQVKKTGDKQYERIDHASPPPLIAHLLRTLPQIQILEALAYPYRKYSGGGLFGSDVMTKKGVPIPLQPRTKIAQILGMPISETDYRALQKAHQTVMKGGNMIEKNISRSKRAAERIKLGLE